MNYTFAAISLLAFVYLSIISPFVLARAPKNPLNCLLFIFTTAGGYFCLTDFLGKIANTPARAEVYFTFHYLFWTIFIAASCHFSLKLLKGTNYFGSWLTYFIVYAPIPILLYLQTVHRLFYSGAVMTPWGFKFAFGRFYLIFALYSSFYFLWATVNAARALRHAAAPKEKKQDLFIFLGYLVSYLAAMPFEIILPIFGRQNVFTLPMTGMVMATFFTYAMLRYGLLVTTPGSVMEKIIESMPDFLVIVDSSKRISLASRGFMNALGYGEEEMIGREFNEFLMEESRTACDQLYPVIFRGEKISNFRLVLKRKDGSQLTVSLNATLAREHYEEEVGCLLLMRDISLEEMLVAEQKETIAELTSTKEKMLVILKDTTAARDETAKKAKELEEKINELEGFHKLAVGRELKMISLEKEIEALRDQLGQGKKSS